MKSSPCLTVCVIQHADTLKVFLQLVKREIRPRRELGYRRQSIVEGESRSYEDERHCCPSGTPEVAGVELEACSLSERQLVVQRGIGQGYTRTNPTRSRRFQFLMVEGAPFARRLQMQERPCEILHGLGA